MIPNLEPSQNICQIVSNGGSGDAGPSNNDTDSEINGADTKFGDCGDPSGVLGPLLAEADEKMGALDGFDNLVNSGFEKASEIGDNIKDIIEKVGPAALAL